MAAVAMAVTGFVVLMGSAEQSRLSVRAFVDANSRSAYDLLIRPVGAQSSAERASGLVQPGYLAGRGGGISSRQWEAVREVDGVDVAAPAGIAGYIGVNVTTRIDLTPTIDTARGQQIIRVWPSTVTDAGLTTLPDPEPRFAYVTKRPVAVPHHVLTDDGREGFTTPDGGLLAQEELLDLGCANAQVPYVYLEKTVAGDWLPICGTQFLAPQPGVEQGSPQLNMSTFSVFQALPDGRYLDFTGVGEAADPLTGTSDRPQIVQRPVLALTNPLWLPIGVIDPTAEARLVDLPETVRQGIYLPTAAGDSSPEAELVIPSLLAERLAIDEQIKVDVTLLQPSDILRRAPQELLSVLANSPGDRQTRRSYDLGAAYGRQLSLGQEFRLDAGLRFGPAVVSEVAGQQAAQPVSPSQAKDWRTAVSVHGEAATGRQALQPLLSQDVAFRPIAGSAFLDPQDVRRPARLKAVGTFAPDAIRGFSEFAAVPLELYDAGVAARSGESSVHLRPNSNPMGYLALPPSTLISVQSAQQLTGRDDVVGAVRVRVAGVRGADPMSRERVRVVAEEIAKIPGLQVDITAGSSPQPQSVSLPGGRYGRPATILSEMWPRKGAILQVVQAVDSKTLTIFALILVVCTALFVGTTSAAFRARRRELALLSVMGWPRRRVVAFLLVEAAGGGFVASVIAVVAAHLLAAATGLPTHLEYSLWAVPAATVTTTVVALVPALRAVQRYPSLTAGITTTPGWVPRGNATRIGMAWSYAIRAPGRALGGAFGVAVAVAAAAVLLAIKTDFAGSVVGSLLGDAVAVRVRASDIVLAAILGVIGLASVGNTIYVGLRERAAEINTLRAVGWSERSVRVLAAIEATIVGGVGSAAGVLISFVVVSQIFGAMTTRSAAGVLTLAILSSFAAGVCGLIAAAATPGLSAATLTDEG
ncbi:ABC transporter permease [Micromonospora matsumotoense]|uniref:ABC transporter permease n=1 Tax=Micromonospora matsumotoense TaxID=121616 RepID=UPI0034047AA0